MVKLISPPLSCRECRAALPAYVHRELKPGKRHRVYHHLNTCSACYAAYRQEQDLARDLQDRVPSIGTAPPLDKIWAGVQAEMVQPAASRGRLVHPSDRARYSLAAAALVIALVLPWSLNVQQRAMALPMPPTPGTLLLQETPTISGAVVMVTAEAPTPEAPTNERVPTQPTPVSTDSPE